MKTDKVNVNKKSIVLTHNDLNKVSFPGFEKRELDFLYGAIITLYNKEDETLIVPLDEMFEKVGFHEKSKTEGELGKWVDNFSERASRVICPMILIDPDDTDTFAYIPFFGAVSFNFSKNIISFKVNPSIQYMLQKQKKEYTAFSFGEFSSLNKKYSKLLFRLLSQWKTHGEFMIELDEFRRLLDIPESYVRVSKITQAVVNPSVNDVKQYFPNLKAETVKKKNKAIGYKFTWDAEHFKNKKSKEIADKQSKKTKRKDVTPENKSVDELQDELQRMWEEKGLER